MIAVQQGGSSLLGEVWYAEAPQPTGPWRRAKKIVTHDRYSFYNPVQHPFFDQDGGRRDLLRGHVRRRRSPAIPWPRRATTTTRSCTGWTSATRVCERSGNETQRREEVHPPGLQNMSINQQWLLTL